jgi:hypothetical protein
MKNRSSEGLRSPLKAKPLRYPGQSLDEEIERLFNEEVTPYILVGVLVVILAALVWLWFLLDTLPNPLIITFLAILVVAYCAYKVVSLKKRVRRLKLGRDGERAVGQYLEQLRESGCRVFHDIVGDDFNIDYVVLSQSGIFTVETKTYNKPAKGKPVVNYDGQRVLVNGYEPERDLLGQAAAQREWLRETLGESTGKRFPVKAVILFPGWYVETSGRAGQHEVWVLNPKALPSFIREEKQTLTSEDVMLASYHLTMHIRAT